MYYIQTVTSSGRKVYISKKFSNMHKQVTSAQSRALGFKTLAELYAKVDEVMRSLHYVSHLIIVDEFERFEDDLRTHESMKRFPYAITFNIEGKLAYLSQSGDQQFFSETLGKELRFSNEISCLAYAGTYLEELAKAIKAPIKIVKVKEEAMS